MERPGHLHHAAGGSLRSTWNEHRHARLRVAGGQLAAFEHDWTRHGNFHDLKFLSVGSASVFQSAQVRMQGQQGLAGAVGPELPTAGLNRALVSLGGGGGRGGRGGPAVAPLPAGDYVVKIEVGGDTLTKPAKVRARVQ